jgi:hypothetical protein
MKKIDKSISKDYLPVKLYLDDLESIEEILKEVSTSLSFETEDYKFDSIEELKTHFKRAQINELHVKSSTPYITMDFTRMWTRIYVSSSDISNAGVFYRLDQIISNRNRKLKWRYSFYFLWIVNILLWIINGVPFGPKLIPVNPYLSISIDTLAFMWLIWFFFIKFRRHSVIVLTHKNSEAPFLQRNKDNLILAIISALLGAILGIGGTLILNQIQSKPSSQSEGNSR